MKTQLRNVWESRSPRDRNIIMLMTAVIAVILYMALVQTGARERQQLSASVMTLRMQAARLALQANELQRLRAAPATTASQTDLRALVQAQAAAAGLSGTLVKMDAPDANQIVVVFEAVAFADSCTG